MTVTMPRLLDLIGRNVTSPEAAKILSDFPKLRPEAGGGSPEDRLEAVSYLRSEADGLLVKLSAEGEVLAVFMLSEGKDGCSEFRGELPGRLNFSAEPEDAIKALGPPAVRQPPKRYGAHEVGELLRFDLPEYSIHFQFRPDHDGIDIVTAMAARAVPGRKKGSP